MRAFFSIAGSYSLTFCVAGRLVARHVPLHSRPEGRLPRRHSRRDERSESELHHVWTTPVVSTERCVFNVTCFYYEVSVTSSSIWGFSAIPVLPELVYRKQASLYREKVGRI